MDVVIEERRVAVGELSTHYLSGGQGPPLVLLHGHAESSESWRLVLPALARTHRVYAPDFPGSGLSAKPAVYSQPPSFYSDFLAAFLDAVGVERTALVGNSHGGLAALRLAFAAPARVSALALAGSSGLGRIINPALLALTLPGLGDAAVAWFQTPLGAAQWTCTFASLVFARPLLAPRAWLAQHCRQAQIPGHMEGALACLRGELDLVGQREVFLDELPSLTMPTLVAWGTQDMVLPSHQASDAAARLRKGRVAWLPGCGHLAHVERPDRFVAVVGRFLADAAEGVGSPR